eukprot:scaffold84251_cov22-Prasinocladus_malaysianus.AAC.1
MLLSLTISAAPFRRVAIVETLSYCSAYSAVDQQCGRGGPAVCMMSSYMQVRRLAAPLLKQQAVSKRVEIIFIRRVSEVKSERLFRDRPSFLVYR